MPRPRFLFTQSLTLRPSSCDLCRKNKSLSISELPSKGVWILLQTVYRSMLSKVCFWYGLVDGGRIIHLAKLAATAPFANFANQRCESSLTSPMIHSQRAENEAIFDIIAIPFANFAKWVITYFTTIILWCVDLREEAMGASQSIIQFSLLDTFCLNQIAQSAIHSLISAAATAQSARGGIEWAIRCTQRQ